MESSRIDRNGKRWNRREFLQHASSAAVLALRPSRSVAARLEPMTFGLCADVHQDVMHDAPERLQTFVRAMEDRGARFIAQLGDFCIPSPANQSFLDVFHSFRGKHHHVLGNHDTDSENLTKNGYSQNETKAFWGIESNYYAFVEGGIRFLVLDGNDRPADWGTDYPLHIGEAQLAWLENELIGSDEPVIVLSHQSAENAEGLDNGDRVRALLEAANRRAGWQRVLACFSGHHHLNYAVEINAIPYVQVNSMSYFWVGEACQNFAYPKRIHARRPMLEFTAPYKDPVWSTVTVDPGAGEIRIEGRQSDWAGKSPEELGYTSPEPRRRGMSPKSDDRTIAIRS
ncbi:MAG: alkaline phosphatase [Acidobacteria bacterium]|nr:MAG: alkaline phosphatase [Acidobacteriota bacterium]